jgi:hypothetical protein
VTDLFLHLDARRPDAYRRLVHSSHQVFPLLIFILKQLTEANQDLICLCMLAQISELKPYYFESCPFDLLKTHLHLQIF